MIDELKLGSEEIDGCVCVECDTLWLAILWIAKLWLGYAFWGLCLTEASDSFSFLESKWKAFYSSYVFSIL